MPRVSPFEMAPDQQPVTIPDLVWEGIRLFNNGRYFEAHEVLETAWQAENKPVRRLYQGILQAGITYFHVRRGNRAGAIKLADRALPHLMPWQEMRSPIDIFSLIQDLVQLRSFLQENPQKDRLQEYLLKPIKHE